MANILDLIGSSLDSEVVSKLDQEVGVGDQEKTASALDSISKVILAGINKNARSPEGLQSLNRALEKDHNGEVFNDVAGNLLQRDANRAQGNERTLNGAGILRHVLGSNESSVFESLANANNMDKNKLMSLAVKIAPFVMGALGKAKNEEGLDTGGIGALLGGVMNSISGQDANQGSFLNSILDQDGDGSIVDDVAGMGKKLFGGLFKK
ncbi:DUF937 domain-containing protein [Membranicola marinus]|uniref:DUF937 domain-containing protein n=1 Tax=Membranihabitans marinus TaxID=1227546 RepID=A0A953HQL3_9BACT|nr:DUF937 domain-containing protein [Membranihabitans marinus]MBY5959449.1 DUF937 domain-containing protein [Membranihabitans marinus]